MDAKRVARLSSFAAAAAVVLLTHVRAEAQAPKPPAPAPQVRMRWQDFVSGPGGAKRLASLQAAVKKMKSLNSSPKNSADYRRSWEYWANIHGYYGTQSPDGTVARHIQLLKKIGMASYVPYYQGITDQTPPDAIAKKIWATCQHSSQTQQALNFFGWHRMYLYYYERVLRWAAGDNTLRLPYWDYTDPAQVALPAGFRSQTSSLFDQKRDPGINDGSSTLDPDSTDVNDLLPIPAYFTYESQIEEGIHGYVHCTVGPNCPVAHMGDVPVAGNDTIFYSHHANIDRLWACWQKLHGTPAGSWQNQPFSFVDETGALQTKPVKDFLSSAALGYEYDNVANCARPTVGPEAVAVAAPSNEGKKAMIGASKSIAIKQAVTSVDLDVPQPKLKATVESLERPGTVELVLRDVTAESHPGVLFNVYLAKKGDPSSRQHVGTISWFGAFRHHGTEGPVKKTLSYDVTRKLRALGGAASSGLTVVIEATEGRRSSAGAAQTEALRNTASQHFRAEANLRIGAIELRAVPATPEKKK
jgi:hypothetical protein